MAVTAGDRLNLFDLNHLLRYSIGILLTLLCASLMMLGAKLESLLPSHPAIAVMLRGEPKRQFKQTELTRFANDLGFRFAPGSLSIELVNEREE